MAYSWIKDSGLASLCRSSLCKGVIFRPWIRGWECYGGFLSTLSTLALSSQRTGFVLLLWASFCREGYVVPVWVWACAHVNSTHSLKISLSQDFLCFLKLHNDVCCLGHLRNCWWILERFWWPCFLFLSEDARWKLRKWRRMFLFHTENYIYIYYIYIIYILYYI